MKKIFSSVLSLALILGTVAIFASCGAPENAGAEVKVFLGETIYDFDPTDYYSDSNADQLMSLIYEPLFTIDAEGKLECAAADDYKVDEENRRITIELKETYWSDGTRVKAEDYIYAWRDVLLEPNKPNPASALLFDIVNAVEIKNGNVSTSEFGATATLFELSINYREGADYNRLLKNLASVATSPIRQDSATQAPTYWSKSSNNLVTNGAFKISVLNYLTGEIELERNIGYHQNPNTVDYDNEVIPYKLVSFMSSEGNEVVYNYSDIENKIAFYMGDAPLAERSANKDKAVATDDLSTYTYVFNTENPLFEKPYVRKALSLAIDRSAIVNAITFAKAADGFLPDIVEQNSQKALISADAKLDEARALLEQVDFTGLEKAFTLTVNDDPESIAIASLVIDNWKLLGFEVELETVSSKTVTIKDFATNSDMDITDSELQSIIKEASYGKRDFDVIGMDWQMYSTDALVALSAFTSDMNGNGAVFANATAVARKNISGWSNAAYDSYIKAAYTASDDAVRTENLRKAEELLVDSAAVIPVVYNRNFSFIHEDLSEIVTDGLGNFVLTKAELKDYEKYIK